MSGRTLAIVFFAVTTGLYVAGLLLSFAAGELLSLNELVLPVFYAFAVTGVLIAWRRPRNAIAWICLGIGCVWGLESALFGTALYGLANPGTVPRPEALAAIAAPLWVPGIFVMATFLLMVFPDGHLPSRRWAWLPWTVGSAIDVFYLALVLTEPVTYSYGRPAVENPFAAWLEPWLEEGGIVVDVIGVLLVAPVFIGIAASITAVILRFQRASGVQRQQLKWLATAGSGVVVLFVVSIFLVDLFGDAVGFVAASFFIVIPISIGIAVLRYRLYEIDRLVSRTVSYAVIAGLLAAVYASIAIGLPQVLPVNLDSSLLVAIATLAIVALFSPVRARVQRVVDRRFNRVRYDSEREIEQFANRLRTELDLGDLTGEVLDVVTTTMQPATAGVWIRERGR
jgi:hypothetical protein